MGQEKGERDGHVVNNLFTSWYINYDYSTCIENSVKALLHKLKKEN